MAGGGVALIGSILVPLLSGLFGYGYGGEPMESILEAINEWIKEILIGAINGNLSTMFGDVNEKVGTIAAEVGKTPQGWNANIFSMIQNLSENVIVPIAGLVITYVLCYELISMVTEKNNMHDDVC